MGYVGPTLHERLIQVAPCRGGEWRLRFSPHFPIKPCAGGMSSSNSHKGTLRASHDHASNPHIVFLGTSDSIIVFLRKLLFIRSLD